MRYRANLGCLWLLLAVMLIGGTPLMVGLLRVFAVFVLVTMIAGGALTWWVRRNAVLQYARQRGPHSRRFVEILVALLVRLAQVDGALDRREVTAIRHFFQYGLGYRGERLLWVRDLIKAARSGRESVADLCNELRSEFGLQERMILIQVLTRVAQADGALTASETRFIQDVARRVGLAAFVGAFEQGPFSDARFEDARTGAGPTAGPGNGRVDHALSELGLIRGATAPEIKAAWRKLSLENHPDRAAHLGEEFRKLAEERMRRINSAYDVLKHAGLAS
jgi:DnaJ like chaperone protein